MKRERSSKSATALCRAAAFIKESKWRGGGGGGGGGGGVSHPKLLRLESVRVSHFCRFFSPLKKMLKVLFCFDGSGRCGESFFLRRLMTSLRLTFLSWSYPHLVFKFSFHLVWPFFILLACSFYLADGWTWAFVSLKCCCFIWNIDVPFCGFWTFDSARLIRFQFGCWKLWKFLRCLSIWQSLNVSSEDMIWSSRLQPANFTGSLSEK